jgi:DNA (cytosine-5)-methyltransferase 1
MLRAIHEIAPRYIVGENVAGLLSWNGGLVFNEVQTDLEAEGYEILPVILPACAVNAPHRRERVWFVAYSDKCAARPPRQSYGADRERGGNNDEPKEWGKQTEQCFGHGDVYGIDTNAMRQQSEQLQPEQREFSQQEQRKLRGASGEMGYRNATDTRCSERQNWLHGKEQGREATEFGDSYTKFGAWTKFPITEPTICSGNDGISNKLDGITFPKWRNESIKAYGNAIVPQVALQIFNAINLHAASYGCR